MSGAAELKLTACPFCSVFRYGPECENCGATAGNIDTAKFFRDLLASWMLSHGYATGHGDSVEGMLGELEGQIEALKYRAWTWEQGCLQVHREVAGLREDIARKGEALSRLLSAAKLLQANAEGCAVNHYGADFELQGLPGWLTDTKADIDSARAALHSLAPGSKGDAS